MELWTCIGLSCVAIIGLDLAAVGVCLLIRRRKTEWARTKVMDLIDFDDL